MHSQDAVRKGYQDLLDAAENVGTPIASVLIRACPDSLSL